MLHRTVPPPAKRRADAIVLAAVKGKAQAPALRPPLTAAARDGRVNRERDGGMSRLSANRGMTRIRKTRASTRLSDETNRSTPSFAFYRARPEQMERGTIASGLEQVGADRMCEGRVVDLERNIFAGFFAGAGPACSNLGPLLVAHVNTVVRRVLGVRMIGRHDGELDIEGEGS